MHSLHTSYADKFEKLLELYPHPLRRNAKDPRTRRWTMKEVAAGTAKKLSPEYLNSFREGKVDQQRPEMEHLDLIAQAIGFPFELWLAEPEQWPTVLADPEAKIRPPVTTYSELLEELFDTAVNPRTGEPFTNQEVARSSSRLLQEKDVRQLREGTFTNPARSQLLALSHIFAVDGSYWSPVNETRDRERKTRW